eukprot:scaffold15316_cov67-Attheya_sp.AAC.3
MALPISTAVAHTGYIIWSPPVSVNGTCKVTLVQMPSCILKDPSSDNGSILVPDALHVAPCNIEYSPYLFP